MPTRTWIVLLRAIGGATHAKMSMAQLRAGCAKAGLDNPRTYIASGNLIVESDLPEARVRSAIEGVITAHGLLIGREHGLNNAVILRRPADLIAVLAGPAFPDAARDRPSRLQVVFLDRAPDAAALQPLRALATTERLHLSGSELTVDYPDGIATSKLTAKAIERHLDCTGTARNWNTIGKLLDLAQQKNGDR